MQEKSTTATFSTENYIFRKSNKVCENSLTKIPVRYVMVKGDNQLYFEAVCDWGWD
jgi:hypothetical protein